MQFNFFRVCQWCAMKSFTRLILIVCDRIINGIRQNPPCFRKFNDRSGNSIIYITRVHRGWTKALVYSFSCNVSWKSAGNPCFVALGIFFSTVSSVSCMMPRDTSQSMNHVLCSNTDWGKSLATFDEIQGDETLTKAERKNIIWMKIFLFIHFWSCMP